MTKILMASLDFTWWQVTYLSNLGLPGNGKTTELKRIVKDLRRQGHIVFYVNLRDDRIAQKTADDAFLEAEEAMS